ncbi:hypothetical protein VNO80_28988 [Phaseolus coccineus]|uniref:Uncharacterized protein n=1 Tax=Phaseolus coccineus TaxID=3886 RepID=A0AAN9QEH3_PHACN
MECSRTYNKLLETPKSIYLRLHVKVDITPESGQISLFNFGLYNTKGYRPKEALEMSTQTESNLAHKNQTNPLTSGFYKSTPILLSLF